MMRCVALLLALVVVALSAPYDPRCSHHGLIYPDTRVCECFQCFSSHNCSVVDEACVVDVSVGTPGIYQEYWYNNDVDTNVAADYRSPYQDYIPYAPDVSDTPYGIHHVLVPEIQKVHAMYKNANAEGRFIVPAYGCTNLFTAAAYAFSELKRQENPDTVVNIFAKTPYYNGYPAMTSLFPGRMVFTSDETNLNPDITMELNTHPNNPTGDFHPPVYPTSFVVYDSVYLWPSLVDYTEPLDADVVLFSMSKLTGHAGSRFGWGLVKNETIANLMVQYMELSQLEISVDTQYRSYKLLSDLLNRPYHLFNHIKKQMGNRWDEALGYLARQPQRFKQSAVSGTFYMLIECLAENEKDDCYSVFYNAGMIGEKGVVFGLGANYIRLEMVTHQPVNRIFMERLDALTSSS